MRKASGHQCKEKMSGSEKKVKREHVRHFLQKIVTDWKFHVVVLQISNSKEMYKKSVLHVQSCRIIIVES